MNMFSKLNQIKDLKAQAKQMQNSLSQEIIEVEKSNVILKMDATQKVHSITIPDGKTNTELEKIIPELFNDSTKKIQKVMAEKMKSGEISMPDFNF
ncbi:YbaB/EbfC family nucleoid-associated protein [bacterium]|nr:YbaB/EbfC family nucleoid-associated protein [bacterium]